MCVKEIMIGDITCLIENKLNPYSEINSARYFTQPMLVDNIYVQVESIASTTECTTRIDLYYYNVEEAGIYTLYSDELLAPIQSLKIAKEIVELYNNQSLTEFFETIELLSIDFDATTIQLNQVRAAEKRNTIVNAINEVKMYNRPLHKISEIFPFLQ